MDGATTTVFGTMAIGILIAVLGIWGMGQFSKSRANQRPIHDFPEKPKRADYLKGMQTWAKWTLGLGILLLILSLLEFTAYDTEGFNINLAISNLAEAFLLIISAALLWKRNAWVILSFALSTLISLVSPLINGTGYGIFSALLLVFPLAFSTALHNFWKQQLFSHQNTAETPLEA